MEVNFGFGEKKLIALYDNTNKGERNGLSAPLLGFTVQNNSNDCQKVSHHPGY